jgi:hypothetical protein
MTEEAQPRLNDAMLRNIGGSVKAQQRFIERVQKARSPAVIEIATSYGKRCRFAFLLSLWVRDDFGGAAVWWFFTEAHGPGSEQRNQHMAWRVSRHALVRLVQRAKAHDAFKLLYAMRELAGAVTDAIADAKLVKGDGQVLKVPFPGGVAVVDWPADSDVAVVKTILPTSAAAGG